MAESNLRSNSDLHTGRVYLVAAQTVSLAVPIFVISNEASSLGSWP